MSCGVSQSGLAVVPKGIGGGLRGTRYLGVGIICLGLVAAISLLLFTGQFVWVAWGLLFAISFYPFLRAKTGREKSLLGA